VSPPAAPAMMGKEKGWAEMTAEERGAASVLGYNEQSWEDGASTPATMKRWVLLSPQEDAAAQFLGYAEAEWDLELPSVPLAAPPVASAADVSPPAPLAAMGKEKGWAEMTARERSAASVLGYDEQSWEDGEDTASTAKRWAELSPRELAAAQVLGYTQGEWDAQL